jgi:hypothetical protein
VYIGLSRIILSFVWRECENYERSVRIACLGSSLNTGPPEYVVVVVVAPSATVVVVVAPAATVVVVAVVAPAATVVVLVVVAPAATVVVVAV